MNALRELMVFKESLYFKRKLLKHKLLSDIRKLGFEFLLENIGDKWLITIELP